jgi:hypothetical protein
MRTTLVLAVALCGVACSSANVPIGANAGDGGNVATGDDAHVGTEDGGDSSSDATLDGGGDSSSDATFEGGDDGGQACAEGVSCTDLGTFCNGALECISCEGGELFYQATNSCECTGFSNEDGGVFLCADPPATACSPGPGIYLDDTCSLPSVGDGGTDAGGTDAGCLVVATDFDQSCSTDSDCVAVVSGGDVCDPCVADPPFLCQNVTTVSADASAAYAAAIAAAVATATKECGSETFECTARITPRCMDGQCQGVVDP